jgi:hypothetical protein
LQVYLPCVVFGKCKYFYIGSCGNDSVATHSKGFDSPEIGINGQYISVEKNSVRSFRFCGEQEGREQKSRSA